MPSAPVDGRAGVTTIVIAAAAVAVVLAVGVWLVAAPEAPAGDHIGANASGEFAAIDGVDATRLTVVERGDEVSETVVDVALRPGTEQRREVLVSGDRRYERRVSNGSTLWLYDEDDRVAERVPLSETPPGKTTRGDRVDRLFAALNVTRPTAPAAAELDASVSTLPVVPQAAVDETVVANEGPDLVTVRFNGTATVDGREVYVLHVEPAESAGYEQTLWVDAETFFPLKHRTAWTDDGTPVSVTTSYSNVTFDPGLSAETFAFDPPADATVESVDTPNTQTFESVTALREEARAPVPDPDLGASFRLTYATETTGRVHGAGVRYANETALVTAATYNRTFDGDGDRTATVGDHEAVVDVGATTSVSWNCGDYRYTVRGQGVSAEFLVDLARTVECG
ncbi:LolA family protein [Halobacterium bonnevillei]|uniref:DUF2092 domain-containing protein n=1 Tax=Halobacterium bonnevillei TaxID=2692200 RepID=A0A6B0SNI3_9EURY|nr:DUF2092 domain-containing protein [Halobacterium bonnevillei]MXR21083.1 DUF2092 domain-containing protein [Halobacterium bonnevillei]